MPVPAAVEDEVLLLYGSETGTARDVAYRIAEWLRRRRIPIHARGPRPFDSIVARDTGGAGGAAAGGDAAADASPLRALACARRAILVCSTTGDGEAPRLMVRFWLEVGNGGDSSLAAARRVRILRSAPPQASSPMARF